MQRHRWSFNFGMAPLHSFGKDWNAKSLYSLWLLAVIQTTSVYSNHFTTYTRCDSNHFRNAKFRKLGIKMAKRFCWAVRRLKRRAKSLWRISHLTIAERDKGLSINVVKLLWVMQFLWRFVKGSSGDKSIMTEQDCLGLFNHITIKYSAYPACIYLWNLIFRKFWTT